MSHYFFGAKNYSLMSSNKVIIFSAPSGSGKTTLVQHLLTKFPKLRFSVSATTRPPRAYEQNGKDYYFISKEAFEAKIALQDFVEYEQVYQGAYYGTLKSELLRLHNDQKIVLFDVDVVGGKNLKNYFGQNALAIFVKVPSLEILEQRLRKRGSESEESIQKRVQKADKEVIFEQFFDYTLINDQLEIAFEELENLVRKFLEN